MRNSDLFKKKTFYVLFIKKSKLLRIFSEYKPDELIRFLQDIEKFSSELVIASKIKLSPLFVAAITLVFLKA